MRQYKTNLGLLTSRYGDIERRLLEVLGPEPDGTYVPLPGAMGLMVMYLLADGLLLEVDPHPSQQMRVMGIPPVKYYALTTAGREFVTRWLSAESLP